MMVTRRNLISALLMMVVLFVLTQCFMIVKEGENDYTENDHYGQTSWNSLNEFRTAVVSSTDQTPEREYVVYIGSEYSDAYKVVYAWCTYRKMDLLVEHDPSRYRRDLSHYPTAIIINGEELDMEKDLTAIELWERGNIPLIFATLPEVHIVQKNPRFMSLIGVDDMLPDDQMKEKLVGYHVLGGFLLGGEKFYELSEKEDKRRMDLNLNIPRYHVFNNTKSYIIGMYKTTPKKTELQPSLLWRYTSKGTNVFVVNGSFLRDISGIGYLSAIMAQIREYDVYPVVNVQEFSLLDFPGMSDENQEEMMRKYSRDQRSFYRDLVWPGMVSMVEESGQVPTCYMAPQMDYGKKQNEPLATDLYYYLKQMKERRGEMGISMNLLRGTRLDQKIASDQKFLRSAQLGYHFGAIYASQNELTRVLEQLKLCKEDSYLAEVRTVVTDERKKVFDYVNQNVTVQSITGDLNPYYYTEDLKNRGYETALGYINTAVDMSALIWSDKEDDEWQKVSKLVSANLATYWKCYSYLDRVSASEADRRIRNFLALTYEWDRKGNDISVKIRGFHDRAWFIVRLREGDVTRVDGGSFEKAEDGVYLIQAENDHPVIQIKKIQREKKLVH